MGHTVSMINTSERGQSGYHSDDNYIRVGIHLDLHQVCDDRSCR